MTRSKLQACRSFSNPSTLNEIGCVRTALAGEIMIFKLACANALAVKTQKQQILHQMMELQFFPQLDLRRSDSFMTYLRRMIKTEHWDERRRKL